jgi:hypothetical protein
VFPEVTLAFAQVWREAAIGEPEDKWEVVPGGKGGLRAQVWLTTEGPKAMGTRETGLGGVRREVP